MKHNTLIIDGNAVYEMDMDCLKKKQADKQLGKRLDCNTKPEFEYEKKQQDDNKISIYNVDE